MTDLFGVGIPSISKHLANIFKSGELQKEVVISKMENTTQHGAMSGKEQTHEIAYHNLDAIISVGYRVNSRKATHFRQWATSVLKGYMIKGFAMHDLANSIDKFLAFRDYKVLNGYGSISMRTAKDKATKEYEAF